MEVDLLAIPKKKAEEEFQALKQALKQNKKAKLDDIYSDYQKVYGHMRHGKKIIDIYEAFKRAGLNEEYNPKLAICRADAKQCYCYKNPNGSVVFSFERDVQTARKSKNDVYLPPETFKFIGSDGRVGSYINWDDRYIKTIVPVIPAKILVNEIKVLLKNFHIIWEVEEWKPIPPRDPILVKRLTPNLFGVLATWNLTKLERAVIRGRIQT